jgi:hypothetical protein
MIVAISYHDGDLPLMRRWADHVFTLGLYKTHKLILVPIRNATTDGVLGPLMNCFGEVVVEPCTHAYGGWPQSCNMAFESVAWIVSTTLKRPFLWMEPDAIPLKASWIDDIENAYNAARKPFMGSLVEIAGIMPNGVNHMSGVGVYHWDLHRLCPSIFNNEHTAWDIASASNVVPQMHNTSLIQHDWVPTAQWRREKVTKDLVNPLAVIYHPDKLGVLMLNGAIPNDVQGDPAMGAVLVTQRPHETKERPDDYKGEVVVKSFPVNLYAEEAKMIVALDAPDLHYIVSYAKTNPKAKKEVLNLLVKEGILTKGSCAKLFGKKVRSSVGKRQRPKSGDRVQVSSSTPLEG